MYASRRPRSSPGRREAAKKTISKDATTKAFDQPKIIADAQKQVQDAIDQLVETGRERGIQVAVYRGADLVVEAVAGIADPARARPVTSDTPFYNFSIGKGATSTVAHVLAERGTTRQSWNYGRNSAPMASSP